MIKEANVSIDGLTVIAGENDTGKSTLGKALYFIQTFSKNIQDVNKTMNPIIIGLGIPIANVHSMTIWQTVVPLELQGRVVSVRMVISQIVSPISLLGAGIVAKYFGITAVIMGISIFGFLLLFYSWFFTTLPQVEQTIELDKIKLDKIEKEKTPVGAIPTE